MSGVNDIEAWSSTLTVFPPGPDRLDARFDDGIVHTVPFFLTSPKTNRFVPHMTQCFTLAIGCRTSPTGLPITCLFCLGWEGLLPGSYDIRHAHFTVTFVI